MKNLIFIICFMLPLYFQTVCAQVLLETVIISAQKKHPAINSENEGENVTRYYYYPNLSAYYDLKLSKFIFEQNGEWVAKDHIAANYRGYSLFNNYRVEIKDYFGDKPYEFLSSHRKMYPADYTGKSQKQANYKIPIESKTTP